MMYIYIYDVYIYFIYIFYIYIYILYIYVYMYMYMYIYICAYENFIQASNSNLLQIIFKWTYISYANNSVL